MSKVIKINLNGFLSTYPFKQLQFAYYDFLSDIHNFSKYKIPIVAFIFLFFVALPFIFYAEYTSEFEWHLGDHLRLGAWEGEMRSRNICYFMKQHGQYFLYLILILALETICNKLLQNMFQKQKLQKTFIK